MVYISEKVVYFLDNINIFGRKLAFDCESYVRTAFIPCSRSKLRVKIHTLDVLCALISPWAAFALREPLLFSSYLTNGTAYAFSGFAAAVAVLAFSAVGHVLPEYFSRRDLAGILKVASGTVVITTIVTFDLTRLAYIPRSLPAIHLFVLLALMAGWRWVYSSLAHRHEIGVAQARKQRTEHILVIGANRWAWLYSGMMVEALMHGRRKIMAILDENPRLLGRSIHGHQVIGEIRDIEAVLEEYAVHGVAITRVVVAGLKENISRGSWTHLESVCSARGIALEVLAEKLGLLDETASKDIECAPESALAAELKAIRARPYWRIKRIFDVLVSGLLVVALMPLFAFTSLVVLLGIGHPAVFWQKRVGRDHNPLFVYKFRTLRAPFRRDGTPIPEAARLTRVGRFLRATRLDELPQLFSILRGDMSIIGPRPLMPEDMPRSAELRLSVQPGLTGWAQVHGGQLVTPPEKNALDEWYIRNASLWLDLVIVAKTIRTVVRGDRRAEDALVRAMKANTMLHSFSDAVLINESSTNARSAQ